MDKLANRALLEAAEWCLHLSEAEAQTTPEFEQWLQADSANGEAWARVEPNWNIFKGHATAPEVLALRRAALAHADLTPRQTSKRWLLTLAAAASLLLAASAWYYVRPNVYRTHIGEQRVIALTDGSKVQLDSATELSVDYSSHERNLTLARGQARFDVAHDGARPFVVTAGAKKVVATGTAFNVDVMDSRVLVTLIEGDVLVLPRNSNSDAKSANVPNGDIALVAGQELVASGDGSSQVSSADIARVTSWQKGQLLFDDEPLSSVVERVNRYTVKPIVLTDDRIRELRISGVFHTNDIPAFITTITHYLPLSATTRQNSIDLAHR